MDRYLALALAQTESRRCFKFVARCREDEDCI